MINFSIRNMAIKLYIKLYSGNSDTVAMHTRSFRMGVVTGLLLIAGLLPMLAAAQPTRITLSLDPATVMESATPTTITITATLVGGTFSVERNLTIELGSGTSTATVNTDYTDVATFGNLPIPARVTSATTTFSFTAVMDMLDEPAGETVILSGALLVGSPVSSIDTSIPVTSATLTINDPDTAPAFADGASIASPTYFMGETVALDLPEVATDGNGTTTYTLTPALPTGLTFDGAASPPTITGTAMTATEMTYTYTASDTDDDTATLMFTLAVDAMNTAPAFVAVIVSSQRYVQNRMIAPTTLAAVTTPGNGETIYTLTPALPAGLTFDAINRRLSGIPEVTMAETTYTLTAHDSDNDMRASDEASFTFRITVGREDPTSIVLSLEPAEVTESSDATTITITVTLIGGTFGENRGFRFLSASATSLSTATVGTDYTRVPSTRFTIPALMTSGTTTFSFTAPVDAIDEPDGETVHIGGIILFVDGRDNDLLGASTRITINDYAVVTASAGADQRIVPGGTIMLNGTVTSAADATIATTWALTSSAATTTALEAAGVSAGDAATEVTRLEAALAAITTPAGTFPAPAESLGLTGPVPLAFTLTATDSSAPAGQPASATMATDEVVITVDGGPTFDSGFPRTTTLVFHVNQMVAYNLPAATGGTAPLTYTLSGTLPAGLTFDGAARPPTLTGTPTTVAAAGIFTYTVRDANDATDMRSFRISVSGPDIPPTFGMATIAAQTYIAGTAIEPLTLPVATGGNGTITYTLTPDIPGLSLNPSTGELSGTPTTAAATAEHTYTAADGDMNTMSTDEATLTLSITIEADVAPTFPSNAPLVTTQVIAQNRRITPLALPEATGGNGDIIYTLDASPALPAGLTFDGAARPPTITGIPEAIVAQMDYIYRAADSDGTTGAGDEATLIVRFSVGQADPTEIRLSVEPAEVTESSDATTITVTATLTGGTFAAERTITIESSDGTATAGTDYTAVGNTVLTIPANMASGNVDIMLTANVDTDDEPAGETVVIRRNPTAGGAGAVSNGTSVFPATLTIRDYVPVSS